MKDVTFTVARYGILKIKLK